MVLVVAAAVDHAAFDRRSPRRHQHAGLDPDQRARAVAAGGRAVPDVPDRDGDERRAARRADPVDQPDRGVGGDGRLPGRGRRLVRAPDGQRAAQARRKRHPARLRHARSWGRCRPGSARSTSSTWCRSKHSPMELRTLLDWVVAIKLRAVPGVVEVNAMGGEAKQYQVVLDPRRLAGYRLSLSDIESDPREEQRRDRRRLHREEPRVVRHPRRRAVPERRGHREHGRHVRRGRHAGADQATWARSASGRRCASARSPSTARARSSRARS